jgi:hypothetical protein
VPKTRCTGLPLSFAAARWTSAWKLCIYPFVTEEAVTLTDVIWRRQTSLLFAALLVGACAVGPPPKPDIPNSISPGWTLLSLNKSALPSGVPPDGEPACWKAGYAGPGPGSADVWICWYKATGNAFEAMQRARAEAQAVKFQDEHYFILVKWNNVPKASLTVLVRALQKALQPAH